MTNALSKRNNHWSLIRSAKDFRLSRFYSWPETRFLYLERLLRMLFFFSHENIETIFIHSREEGANKSALFWRKIQMGVGKSSKFLKAYLRANCGYVKSFSHDGPSSPSFRDWSGCSHIDRRKSKWNLEAGWTQCSWQNQETTVPLLSCHWPWKLLPLTFFNWSFLLYCLINIDGPYKNAWLPHGKLKYAHKRSVFGKLQIMAIFFPVKGMKSQSP